MLIITIDALSSMPPWVMISVQWVCNGFAERRLESLQNFDGRLGAIAMHFSMHEDWFAHSNTNSKSRGSEVCCGSQLPWLEGEDQGNDDEELGQKQQQQGKRKQQPQHWVHDTPAAAPNNNVSSFSGRN
jgi:hypothetical protein